jgi:hypothetical protein
MEQRLTPPTVGPLASGVMDHPPIVGASFQDEPVSPGAALRARVLRLAVEDQQPAGTYSAVVFDATTHLPLGTLVVTVFD